MAWPARTERAPGHLSLQRIARRLARTEHSGGHLSLELAAARLARARHARWHGAVLRALVRPAAVLRPSGARTARPAAEWPAIGACHSRAASGLRGSAGPNRTRSGSPRARQPLVAYPLAGLPRSALR